MKDPLLRDCRHLNLATTTTATATAETNWSSTGTSRSTISTSESGQELWPVGVKLGIVRLGYSAGKLKYTLVDEQDIVLAREYTFEARLEIFGHDNHPNRRSAPGSGAVVFAYAYLTNDPRMEYQSSSPSSTSSQYSRPMILLQDLIWRRHHGPIPERKRVVHRNHISMDNRLDNLCLIDNVGFETTHVWYTMVNQVHHHHHHHHNHHQHHHLHHRNQQRNRSANTDNNNNNDNNDQAAEQAQQQTNKTTSNDLHLTLFWAAIQQLPPEHLQQQHLNSNNNGQEPVMVDATAEVNSASRCYDTAGNMISDQESISYFECHYGPCVRIERCPREFSICGRCQETRYCGTTCQQLDWPYHKRYCRYKARRTYAPYYRITGSPPSSSSSSSTAMMASGSRSVRVQIR